MPEMPHVTMLHCLQCHQQMVIEKSKGDSEYTVECLSCHSSARIGKVQLCRQYRWKNGRGSRGSETHSADTFGLRALWAVKDMLIEGALCPRPPVLSQEDVMRVTIFSQDEKAQPIAEISIYGGSFFIFEDRAYRLRDRVFLDLAIALREELDAPYERYIYRSHHYL